jgi:hypothetical protein
LFEFMHGKFMLWACPEQFILLYMQFLYVE